MSEGPENLPELPLNPGSYAWVYLEAADPLHLELARRGAEHVLGVVADWVGWEYDHLAWEYGWVIQVEDRDSEWEVIVQGLTDDERVLNLLVPEPTSATLDLRLAVDLVAKGGSVVLVYDSAKRRNSAGEGCSGTLVGIVPAAVDTFGTQILLVTAGQQYGLLPEWWPTLAPLPPIPTKA